MRCLFVAVLIGFVLVVYASAIELFQYNLTTPDGRKFQYIFDVSDPASQSAGDALSRASFSLREFSSVEDPLADFFGLRFSPGGRLGE